MEMAIAGSPGWSETVLVGGKLFSGKLAHPPNNTGAFQDLGVREEFGRSAGPPPQQFYADAAVVAFRIRAEELQEESSSAKITSSGEGLEPSVLSDGNLEKTTRVPIPALGVESWIQFEYSSPRTVRAVTYVTKDPNFIEQLVSGIAAPERNLEASDDGQNFRKIANLSSGRAPEYTISFEPVKAKYFRVTFKHNPPPPIPAWAEGIDPASKNLAVVTVNGKNLGQVWHTPYRLEVT